MKQGYISLYRKLLKSRLFQNEGLLKVWIWCLLKANFKGNWVPVKIGIGCTEVRVEAGQFIFGRLIAAKELNMPPSTIWKRMLKLKNMQNLNIQSNNQYSIITIINWHTYQNPEEKGNRERNREGTGREQGGNTNNNVNKDNKDNKREMLSQNIDKTIRFFCNLYKTTFGVGYITRPTDKECIEMILNIHPLSVVEDMVIRFMQDPDPYFAKNGRSISMFASQINRYGSTKDQVNEINYDE